MLRATSCGALLLCLCLEAFSTSFGQEPAAAPTTRKASAVYPLDIASDGKAIVYVADRNLPGVWKYDGTKSEVFVRGSKRFREKLNAVRCVAMSPSGDVVAGDPATREVYKLAADGTATPLVSGIIGIPVDLAFASDGTLYIADVERRVVWKLAPGAAKPEVFADVNPRGVYVDSTDRLWVVSQNDQQLLRIKADGSSEVLVDKRTFDFPHQVVVDAQGIAWVTDGYKHGVWKVEEGKAPELAFSGAPFQNPVGIAIVDGRLAVVDPHAQSVFRLGDDGKFAEWFKIVPPAP
jgi:sugar lactone lactonase YvrE